MGALAVSTTRHRTFMLSLAIFGPRTRGAYRVSTIGSPLAASTKPPLFQHGQTTKVRDLS